MSVYGGRAVKSLQPLDNRFTLQEAATAVPAMVPAQWFHQARADGLRDFLDRKSVV